MEQAQLCFGEVRHKRLAPAQHAFAYRLCYLRLPLRSLGEQGFGTRLFSRNRFNLFSFHDSDHGDGQQPLTAWIDRLLQGEGITDADGEIWLQTFPRVLGYVFNPVSFWFCHRRDGALRAIVCAVNNTFGERHNYLLDTGQTLPWGAELRADKCFHVSPFFAVDGGYRFRFMRTARADGEATMARIDYGDATGTLLQTSISGRAAPIGDKRVLHAFLAFPMMTVGVMLKIHWQALRLWLKHVPFFRKPLPPLHGTTR